MVFATIYYQYGIRNWEQADQRVHLNNLSNQHYHFALSKFFDLASSQSFLAVQAMAMIAAHSRSFPKPGCGSLVSSFAIGRAIELNLHRASKLPTPGTNLDNEMRKRVWWSILVISVTLNGRLGKPMPISVEEMDVDFPEPIPDELLSEHGVDTTSSGSVAYHVGLAGFRIVPLFIDMYASLYSVRRNATVYRDVVNALEGRLTAWKEAMHPSLKIGTPEDAVQENRVYALYAQLFWLEFRLCLRHPSVAMTDDPNFMAENTKACEATAKEMLDVVHSLLKLRSLDTTWYQISVYVGAAFSTLVAYWERRFDSTPADIASLRGDMSAWQQILAESASFVG
jgi:hypothetical protein